jgi:hypothetical protein
LHALHRAYTENKQLEVRYHRLLDEFRALRATVREGRAA